ncbi:PREDICTED: uncharacterized protein LOC106743777 [Dinoponera quadriceps]|uniref:Uncharacterized protein LOC106743777 n=1 Tax=Dinoponera quadriceps TaxID=609295 RepID=A0A6P3X6C8_DINQU|nr:PREDICTED: uncharacterized protein LOC106743777 [Dinoponera quadriceps]
MNSMFLRTVFIFMIFLYCFQFCLCTNCANFPYHPLCRGTMKRTFNPDEFSNLYVRSRPMYDDSHNDCSIGANCKPKIKYLFVLLNDVT